MVIGNNLATLAQLVEQHFCKVKVPGPNPGGGSKLFSYENKKRNEFRF